MVYRGGARLFVGFEILMYDGNDGGIVNRLSTKATIGEGPCDSDRPNRVQSIGVLHNLAFNIRGPLSVSGAFKGVFFR